MPVRYIKRSADLGPGENQKNNANTIRVDSDTNTLKFGSGASGTTEKEAMDLSSAQSAAGKVLTAAGLDRPLGVVVALEGLFTQVAGNKTHTMSFDIPAGGTILDIVVTNTAVWDSGTSATLKVGINGGDDDCFFTAVDLKTVPAAGKSMNFAWPGASNAGASIPEIDQGAGNTQLGATNGLLYNATVKTIDAIVTDVNVAGAAGRTRVLVLYALPVAFTVPVVT